METRPIKSIKVRRRHRKNLGDLETLAESIRKVGLLHPVVIDGKNRLIAGQRRLEAAKLLGWKTIPVRVIDLDEIVLGEFAENACRKDFAPSEIAAIAKAIQPVEEAKARQRRLANLRQGQHRPESPNGRNGDNGEARNIVARYTGIGHTTLAKITAITDAADENPTLYGHLKETMDEKPRAIHGCWLRLQAIRQQQAAQEDKIESVDPRLFRLKENEILCGDCREILPKIGSETFHGLITDPPYGLGIRYNGNQEAADEPEAYWRWFGPIYRELLRVLKPGGFCAIYQSTNYLRYFWDWFGDQQFSVYASCRVQVTGWKGAGPISSMWTPVVVFYKGRPRYWPQEFPRSRNWFVSNSQFDKLAKAHPCPAPLDQCIELVRSFTCEGGLILDPFCGVGTVPLACSQLGRRFLGIECESDYVRVARQRMKDLGAKDRTSKDTSAQMGADRG